MIRVHLLRGREKSLLRRHPWIFDGALLERDAAIPAGETVLVCDAADRPLAKGAWSPASQLRVRIWSFDPEEEIDGGFFRRRIRSAVELRRRMGLMEPDGGCRMVYSESDGLPGVIADRFGKFAVMQLLSAGAEKFREELAAALLECAPVTGVFERSDSPVRRKESLPERVGPVAGEALPARIRIAEEGLLYEVDPLHGQKTGFYFDLRSARAAVRAMAAGRRVLNMFAYTGGFACAALAGGALETVNADSSAPALKQCAENLRLNGFDGKFRNLCGDAFDLLRQFDAEGGLFDMVILDPPKLIPGKSAMLRGCRAYQDLARMGFRLLAPGGILCNFSCSGAMEAPLFQKITADAALEAGVNARIVRRLEQSPDHPTLLSVPETFYLKGLVSIID